MTSEILIIFPYVDVFSITCCQEKIFSFWLTWKYDLASFLPWVYLISQIKIWIRSESGFIFTKSLFCLQIWIQVCKFWFRLANRIDLFLNLDTYSLLNGNLDSAVRYPLRDVQQIFWGTDCVHRVNYLSRCRDFHHRVLWWGGEREGVPASDGGGIRARTAPLLPQSRQWDCDRRISYGQH